MPRPWLPSESPHRATPGGIALTLVLCLATLVALNQAARALLSSAGHNLAFRLMREKWTLVRAPIRSERPGTHAAPWLILGDSSGNQGADPETLAAALTTDPAAPAHVLNLCVIADTLVIHDAWMLDEWIARQGPPAGVVIVHTYDIWHREANHPDHPNTAIMLGRVPIPLTRWPLDPPIHFTGANRVAFYTSRYAPLYAEEDTLQALLANPGRTLDRLRNRADIAWQWPDERGFMPTTATRPQAVERDTRGHQNFLRTARFRASADNRAALDRLARLAAEHNFHIYLAAAPMHRSLWESSSMQAYHAALRAFLAEFDGAHENIHIALAEPTPFDASQMQNSDHVALAAAVEYTRALGGAIRAIMHPEFGAEPPAPPAAGAAPR